MAKTTLLQRLRRLPPTRFENFVFDLLIMSGLRNPVWRTPGPDAGRDIEGDLLTFDMSEHLSLERWYVECKRYQRSLDWPAIFEKLSYASNHDVDFLLFVTTGVVTPRAKEEISHRSVRKSRPIVRVWDATLLEAVVLRHPLLLHKYNLAPAAPFAPTSILPLVHVAAKSVQSAYGIAVMHDQTDPALEFAAATLELLSVQVASTRTQYRAIRPYRLARDLYPWCAVGPAVRLDGFDSYGLRALLTAVRLFSGSEKVGISSVTASVCDLTFSRDIKSESARDAIGVIAVASDLEVAIRSRRLRVVSRDGRIE